MSIAHIIRRIAVSHWHKTVQTIQNLLIQCTSHYKFRRWLMNEPFWFVGQCPCRVAVSACQLYPWLPLYWVVCTRLCSQTLLCIFFRRNSGIDRHSVRVRCCTSEPLRLPASLVSDSDVDLCDVQVLSRGLIVLLAMFWRWTVLRWPCRDVFCANVDVMRMWFFILLLRSSVNPTDISLVFLSWSESPPKCNRLFIGPLPTFPENFMQSVQKFLRKVAKRQDKQTTLITVALLHRADHYIFILWFLLISSFFFFLA